MTAVKCPVEAMARDFAVSIATIDELDEASFGLQGKAREENSARQEAAWERVVDKLYEQALDARPTSQAGVGLQLALLIDELVQFETLEWEPADLAKRFKRARTVLRSALRHIDASAAHTSGIAHFFAGERAPSTLPARLVAHS